MTQYINIIDDLNRFVRMDSYLGNKTRQVDSHTVSYMYLRKTYQELGDIMGFDNPDNFCPSCNEIIIKYKRSELIKEKF